MRSVFAAAAAFFLAATTVAGPVNGAVVINAANTNMNFTIDYKGYAAGSATASLSALETFTFLGTSNSGRTYNFNYALTNDSTANSRLRSFGFDVTNTDAITMLSSTGVYSAATLTPIVSSLLGVREACFAAASFLGTCTTGSDAASSAPGLTGTGSFAITLANAMSTITLDNFAVQFQSINPTINGATSGYGLGSVVGTDAVVSAAPEPMTWAMMILGFGLIGAAMRQRGSGRQAIARPA